MDPGRPVALLVRSNFWGKYYGHIPYTPPQKKPNQLKTFKAQNKKGPIVNLKQKGIVYLYIYQYFM